MHLPLVRMSKLSSNQRIRLYVVLCLSFITISITQTEHKIAGHTLNENKRVCLYAHGDGGSELVCVLSLSLTHSFAPWRANRTFTHTCMDTSRHKYTHTHQVYLLRGKFGQTNLNLMSLRSQLAWGSALFIYYPVAFFSAWRFVQNKYNTNDNHNNSKKKRKEKKKRDIEKQTVNIHRMNWVISMCKESKLNCHIYIYVCVCSFIIMMVRMNIRLCFMHIPYFRGIYCPIIIANEFAQWKIASYSCALYVSYKSQRLRQRGNKWNERKKDAFHMYCGRQSIVLETNSLFHSIAFVRFYLFICMVGVCVFISCFFGR